MGASAAEREAMVQDVFRVVATASWERQIVNVAFEVGRLMQAYPASGMSRDEITATIVRLGGPAGIAFELAARD
jgi:hypothetical protein